MGPKLVDAPFAVVLAVDIGAGVFSLCVVAAMFTLFRIFEQTGALIPDESDRNLRWGERKGREFSRISRLLFAPEVRNLRRLLLGIWLLAFASFGAMLLLSLIFGTRVPT